MTCREIADFLDGYLDQSLSNDEQRSFENHLANCPDCVKYLATYKAAVELGQSAFDKNGDDCEVPEELVEVILRARRPIE